jgi:hypothetical protein
MLLLTTSPTDYSVAIVNVKHILQFLATQIEQ